MSNLEMEEEWEDEKDEKKKSNKAEEDWGEGEDNDWPDEEKGGDPEIKIENQAPSLERTISYAIIEANKLSTRQETLIKQTSEVLFVTTTEAACLLRHYGWKAAKLQQEWFMGQDKVRKATGLTLAPAEGKKPKTPSVCSSAFCEESMEGALALNCGHFFCEPCWTAFLTSQIQHGRTCIFATCPGMRCTINHSHKFGCACNEMVPDEVMRKFMKDQTLIAKYNRWLLDSFVEGQKSLRWCTNPSCGNAVEYKSGGSKAVICKCGTRFCFSCSQVAHTPAPCDLVKMWLEKEHSDDATSVWLAARTKTCPKCLVHIEKNKACNHMSCANCKHQFCWLCKGDWSKHGSSTGGYYVCNKYNEDVAKGTTTDEEKNMVNNQKLLQKYAYYYKHFKSCIEGIKFTEAINAKIEKGAKEKELDISKYGFLTEAVEKLIDARRVLQWTYALAYYLKTDKQKALFEYQQEMLVGNTEGLQDIMDNTADIEKLLGMRNEIINRTRTIDKFRNEMVKQVERGDFEELLLTKADVGSAMWTCAHCKTDNKNGVELCVGCTACQKHGEQECKACKKGAH